MASPQPQVESNSCQTTITTYKLTFDWEVDCLSLHGEDESEIKSSVFIEKNTNTRWHASLYFLKLANLEKTPTISVYIGHLSHYFITAFVSYCLYDSTDWTEIKRGICRVEKIYDHCCIFNEDREKLLPKTTVPYGGEVNFHFEINILSDPVTDPPFYDCVPSSVTKSSLVQDFDALLKNQKNCDVVLSVDGKEFLAHKVILSARSAVFAAMFECKMSEANKNRVRRRCRMSEANKNRVRRRCKMSIEDVKGDVFSKLLRFIYTGEVENLDAVACDLLSAADKYSVLQLKAICEQKLSSTLSKSNVLRILLLADKHTADNLKKNSLSFSAAHAGFILGCPEWKTFLSEHPRLANDILLKALHKPY